MIIEEIRCAGLRGATPRGGWTREIASDDCVHTLVAVHTDTGDIGLGSVFVDERLVEAALEVLSPIYVGEPAIEPERLTETAHQQTFWMGRGGTLTHTISGVDIALWDLLGKATGQPVGRLLGGRYRDSVQAYASVLMDEPDSLADKLDTLVQQRFTAFKIGWGQFGRVSDKTDEAIVRSARRAIGDSCRLMVDAGGSDGFWPHGFKWALRTSKMLEQYNVEWFEEPLSPDALHDYVRLREHAPVAIAGGETLTRRQTFIQWIESAAFDVVQPDVTKVGGISEQRRIAWTAEDRGVKYVGHGWNTAPGVAADLQLASSIPSTDLVEYVVGSAYVDDLSGWQFTLDQKGRLPISDRPGLGIELDTEQLVRLTGDKRLLIR